MNYKKINRRKFLDYAKLSFVFFVSSCQSLPKKISIGLHKKFLPNSLIDSLPKKWTIKNINFVNKKLNKTIRNQNLILVNDGWLNNIKIQDYNDINSYLLKNLDERSKNYLSQWDMNDRKKLYPIGVTPYALVIKNNNNYKISNKDSWDLLLSKEFSGKIILPNSARIIISLANRISRENPIKALISQDNIYDDKYAIDLLVNTDALLALMPLTNCNRYLKFDARLSLVFPNQGVPLIWNFFLLKKNLNQKEILNWSNKLVDKKISNKLVEEGWYLPFNNPSIQDQYLLKGENNNKIIYDKPSEECWKNSWSFASLKNYEKKKLEDFWKKSLTP